MTCTFYVLPPRDILARQFAGFLTGLFPGLDWTASAPDELAETLTGLAEVQGDVYVVYRDELPDDGDLEQTLAECYGAERGDLVVEVAAPLDAPPSPARLWRITTDLRIDAELEVVS